jgi:hypothetical protein
MDDMNGNGRGPIRYTNKDYESLRGAMLELARERLPEWTDHSPSDLGVMLVEMFAAMGDVVLHYQDRLANESYLETALERRSVVHLLRLIGYELAPPAAASADLTLLFAPDATGTATIATGATFTTSREATGTAIPFQYVRPDQSINLDTLPLVTEHGEPFKIFRPLPVVQVDRHATDEVVGSSDGTAGQRFALSLRPLIADTLVVRVDEGAGPRAWERRDSLLESRADDRHYTVRRDEEDVAWVEFGDGKYGRVPARGRNNVTAAYRAGGGARGNVPVRSITKKAAEVAGLEEVYNERAATGGRDAEPIGEAVARAPRQFRSQGRAVTAHDYESHALAFGVGKARAAAAGWNRIALYVAPAGGGYPTDTLKQDLRAYFETRRIMTSILSLRDPVYVPVHVEGRLEVEAYFFTDQVRQQVEAAVAKLLAFDEVRFGDRLYLSKVYEAIERIEGVRGVEITRFERGVTPEMPEQTGEGRLEFGFAEIPVAADPRGILLLDTSGGDSGD